MKDKKGDFKKLNGKKAYKFTCDLNKNLSILVFYYIFPKMLHYFIPL